MNRPLCPQVMLGQLRLKRWTDTDFTLLQHTTWWCAWERIISVGKTFTNFI